MLEYSEGPSCAIFITIFCFYRVVSFDLEYLDAQMERRGTLINFCSSPHVLRSRPMSTRHASLLIALELVCTYFASILDLSEVRQLHNSALTIPEVDDDEHRKASLKVKEHCIHHILVGCSRADFRFRVLTEFELAQPTWDTGRITIRERVLSYMFLAYL